MQSRLAAQVIETRKALKLSQSELAELAGVSRMPIYYLESGRGSVRLDNLLKILDVLGLRLEIVPKGSLDGN